MKYVIDASTAFKWVVVEADDDKAKRLREGYRNGIHELLSPDIFPAEVANALLVAERRGRIADFRPLLQDVLTTGPQLQASIPLLPRVTAIVSLVRVSIYDALYVALAERELCALITADDKLLRNLGTQFPFIVPLASMP